MSGREGERGRRGGQEKERGEVQSCGEGGRRTLGWVLPCLSVGGGVKLNYPLVPRLPGDVCRGAGALAASGRWGGCVGVCVCVPVPIPVCARVRACMQRHVYARALKLELPSPRRRFQLKSTPGVGPDPVALSGRPPRAPLADVNRFDLSS